MNNLLANLNEPQLAAVTLPHQHALVLAGAGSGKTRVLTTRIAWLISTGQASPQSVLAVTFTNKAAKEMMTRLSAMLPINTRGMWIGTFHGLCNRMLRTHYRDANLPQTFQILDTADQTSAIKRLLKTLNVDPERYPPKNLQWFINAQKESGLRPADVQVYDDFNRKFVELYAAYDEQCQREGVVDFPELLLRCYELLRNNALLRQHYQARFGHVLVDEFQDTNPLQYAWLKLLAGPQSALFAVGDDDQSIYAFRGANVGNMRQFEQEYRVQHLIKLEQNYRSTAHILNAANALIRHNTERLGKELWTSTGEGEPLRVYEALTDHQEADWMVQEIKSLIGEGFSRSQVAVLYRSNAQSRVIEHGLFNAGVAYRVYGGLRFFERAEVKHALAYMRLMENPHEDTAFLRVVNFPTRGIGARSLEQLQDVAKQHNSSLYSAVKFLQGKAADAIGKFIKLIEHLRFATQHMPLHELAGEVINGSGLIEHYQTDREGAERIENLKELVNAAASFTGEEGYRMDMAAHEIETLLSDQPGVADVQIPSPIVAFLSHASLEAGDNQAQANQDAVQLMSVHSAKGLEFDVVFLTGLEDGLFPHENSMSERDGLQEERRLMYVAITRARERLYLSMAQTRMLHGQTRYNLRSRFFDELPPSALKWLTPQVRHSYGTHGYGAQGYGAGHGTSSYGASASESAWPDNGIDQAAMRQYEAKQAANQAIPGGWRVGQLVRHARYGEGAVTKIKGQGVEARVVVNFGRQGDKEFMLSMVKLEAVV